jgi:hypothetical protein
MDKPSDQSKRGLPEFDEAPSRSWLEAHRRFTYKTRRGVRITFHKRRPREGRAPTWNGTAHRRGKSVTQYAGTSETFDLGKVAEHIHAKLGE